ncbi:MAG: NAD kinase [Propionibacteriaceae bacterium]|nr:NAD kinase [Propionibacteriaceae bacterium]
MTSSAERRIAVWIHASRPPALEAACQFIAALPKGFEVLVVPDAREQIQQQVPSARLVDITYQALPLAEVIVVFGGDGTILRAAERALESDIPVLGVNLGHVGFLAELEMSQMPELVDHVVLGDFVLEHRMTIEMELIPPGADTPSWRSVAINEVSLEKAARTKMIDCLVSIDGLPVSRWACDGLLVSTPTGSTAYAFSAGGPVMWPQLEAYVVVPLSAHALFARSMVLAPQSRVHLDLLSGVDGVVVCDGARVADVPAGSRIEIRRYSHDLMVARLSEQPFTSRLVKKFALPIEGWRGKG